MQVVMPPPPLVNQHTHQPCPPHLQAATLPNPASTTQATLALLARLTKSHSNAQVG